MTAEARGSLGSAVASRRAWVGWGIVVGAWFALVYGGCNWLTGLRSHRVRLDFDFERGMPFVPAMACVYLSLNPLIWCSGWALRTPRQWRALAWSMIAAIGAAGIGFLALPADLAYPPKSELVPPAWQGVFAFVHRLVGDHNLFPSLHVALAWICMSAYGCSGPARLRPLWMAWAGGIIAATLLVHEHHLVDVAGGIAVGWLSFRLVYLRLLGEELGSLGRMAQTSVPSRGEDRTGRA